MIETTVVANKLFTFDCNSWFAIWNTDTGDITSNGINPKREFELGTNVVGYPVEYSSFAVQKNRFVYIPIRPQLLQMPNLKGSYGITAIDLEKKQYQPSSAFYPYLKLMKQHRELYISPLWKTSVPYAATPSFANGTVYTGNESVTALDSKTGKIIWITRLMEWSKQQKRNPFRAIMKTAPAISGNWIYISLQPREQIGYLYVLDANTGRTIERYLISETQIYQYASVFRSSPAVVNGWVYVGSTDGCLYAFQGKEQ